MNVKQPRVLVLAGKVTRQPELIKALEPFLRVDVVESMSDALAALRDEEYHAVFADSGDFLPLERELVGEKSNMVLNTIGEGVCVVDRDGRCTWSNRRMRQFQSTVVEKVKQHCSQARMVFANQTGPISDSRTVRAKKYTFQEDGRYFELMISPVVDDDGQVNQVVAVVWDATSGKRLQQKIDAIDAAGRELARIESDAIGKRSPSERLDLLRDKIISFSRDLMHFDHFAIRLLDEQTSKLEVVIADGLRGDVLDIELYAQPEGNGISGYVAATGRSYICHDVEKDSRYVMGLEHGKSSLTVPLRLFGKVIGIYNVESNEVGAFTEDDRQFAEIYGRYVAMALNILNLLVVERCEVVGQLADSVVQEMAQPLNDIVTEAQMMIEEYIGDDSMRAGLHRIVDYVGSIRKSLRDVKQGPNVVLGSAEDKKDPKIDPLLDGKRVLIADDEANIRNTIGDILTQRGCVVEACKDGHEACNLLDQQAFDLVLSDIKMPYRNGYEIFAAARRHSETLPVILMTGFGYDPNHSVVRASAEGLNCVMFKPFKIEALLDEIHKAVGGGDPSATEAG